MGIRERKSATIAIACLSVAFTLCIFAQNNPVESSRGISLTVPSNWGRVQVGSGSPWDSVSSQEAVEPLMRLKKSGPYGMTPLVDVTLLRKSWSLDTLESDGGAEVLRAYESTGIEIDQLADRLGTMGRNKGLFQEYRARYPSRKLPVKHAIFTIPGPQGSSILLAATSDESDFEGLRGDWDAIFGSVAIDWKQAAKQTPPKRGIGFGMALGFLLGSLYWLIARKRGQARGNGANKT